MGKLITPEEFVKAHPAWAAGILRDVAFVQQKDDLYAFIETVAELRLAEGFHLYIGMERTHALNSLSESGQLHIMQLGAYTQFLGEGSFADSEFCLMRASGEPNYVGRRLKYEKNQWLNTKSHQEENIDGLDNVIVRLQTDHSTPVPPRPYYENEVKYVKVWQLSSK